MDFPTTDSDMEIEHSLSTINKNTRVVVGISRYDTYKRLNYLFTYVHKSLMTSEL